MAKVRAKVKAAMAVSKSSGDLPPPPDDDDGPPRKDRERPEIKRVLSPSRKPQ
jgi:hypothetical protein